MVSRKTVEVGQVIQPGQPLLALVPLEDTWITANFKETQLNHMHPGQPATIRWTPLGAANTGAASRAWLRRRAPDSACCRPKTPAATT